MAPFANEWLYHFRGQRGSTFSYAAASVKIKKLDWACWKQNWTLQPWWHHRNSGYNMPSNHDQLMNRTISSFCQWITMSFLRTEPRISCSSHEGPQSPISMPTTSMTMPDRWFIIFYAVTSIFSCFWCVTHCCYPHQKCNCLKNCTLGLIHQAPCDPRYAVVIYNLYPILNHEPWDLI